MQGTKNIMIVGVGGQGTLLTSKILGKLFVTQSFDVKLSEVHGMSQRGGSVVTYVRYGKKVYSPIVDEGQADYILSFELLEAARAVKFLNPQTGLLITNTQQINPMPVITGQDEYPKNIVETIKNLGINIVAFDALKIANDLGFSNCVNIVLLGKLSKYFDFSEDLWLSAIKESVKPKFVDINVKAFKAGSK